MPTSNASSSDGFSGILYEQIKRINPAVEDMELYEFRYGLDQMYPVEGWTSVKLDPQEEIEKRINTCDFYTGIRIKARVNGRIVLDENIDRKSVV
jgi:hypothetical protein